MLKKVKKLSTLLSVYSLIILIGLNVITAVLMSSVVRGAIGDDMDEYFNAVKQGANREITDFISKYEVVANMLAQDQDLQVAIMKNKKGGFAHSPKFKQFLKTMQNAHDANSDILGLGVGIVKEDAAFIPSGERLAASLKGKVYYNAVTENRTVITEPYIDTVTNKLCISVVVPVQVKQQAQGLICLDLDLSALSQKMAEMSFKNSGRVVLASSDGTMMAYADSSVVGKTFQDLGLKGEEYMKEFASPTGKLVNYELAGQKKVAVIQKMDDTDWRIIVGLAKEEYSKELRSVILTLVVLLALGVGVIGVAIRVIIAKRLKPLSEINEGLIEMSKGNLKIDVQYESEDEIGEMADAMRTCVHSLSTYISEIDRAMADFSQGDLTTTPTVQFEGDFHSIEMSIGGFIAKLTSLLTNISQVADQVSVGSEQVSSGAQVLAEGTTEQASAVQELVATITEVSNQIQTSAKNAQDTNEKVNTVGKVLNVCNDHMHTLTAVMEKISDSSAKINGIIKTIDDISFQTNILALNAAVEAARAGSAGKGFAVVADEVRNLSSKSAEASKNIAELIGISIQTIDEGMEATKQTSEALNEVLEHAGSAIEMVEGISTVSAQQATAVAQITQGIDQISAGVQTNSATAEESAAASEELSGQAGMLKELVGQFTLTKEDSLF